MDALLQRDDMSDQPHDSTLRPVVVFVGGFSPAARDGCLGGQLFACQTLLHSPLRHLVTWVPIDSTQRSLPPPSLFIRLYFVFRRLLLFIRATASPVRCVLLFSSFTFFSVVEKGVMCVIARIRGIRVVWSLRSEIRSRGRLKANIMRKMLRGADVLLCQTDSAVRDLHQVLRSRDKQIFCVPNWIDCASYPVKMSAPDVVTFIFMGWYELEKGVRELTWAAHAIAKEGVPFRLIMAGGGSHFNWIMNAVKELRLEAHVSVHGWVSGQTKAALLAAADVLVLPSYTEGLPNAILEGMASGMAVIASPVGGIPTLIEPSANGLLVPPGDVSALAAAMKRLALSPKLVREIGARNAVKVRDLHDISRAVPLLADVLGAREPSLAEAL